MVEAHHHRPTLKQQNKPFKSKHATKAALKDAAKGRITRHSPKASPSQSAAAQSRLNRRNNAKQNQTKKRQSLLSATKLFSGTDGAPRIVAVIPLCPDVSGKQTAIAIAEALGSSGEDCPETGLWKLKAERFKTSLQFITLPYRSLYAALDAAKAADYVLLVLSPTTEVDAWGDTLLRALQAQGLPDVLPIAAPGADARILKSLLSFVQYFHPAAQRVFDLGAGADVLNAARTLCEGRPGDARWREGRVYVLGEHVEWREGALAMTGVVRGGLLSANRLVHVPNFGDFQVQKIMSAPLPRSSRGGQGMELEPTSLAEPDAEDADSLVSENDSDDMANEQTWPTEEEMRQAPAAQRDEGTEGTPRKKVKKVPKGWSSYQAAWIVDDDEYDDDEETEELDEEAEVEEETEGAAMIEDAEMDEEESRRGVAFEDLDMEEEAAQLHNWRTRNREREQEESDDAQFPDELDTPADVPARERFARYRGLRSLRTSPWDAYENLPRDYARIFQFEDFKRTERNVMRRAATEEGAVEPGTRVTLYLKDVPQEAAAVQPGHPFVVFGLLQHEHKKTVLNFAVQRNTEYDGSVRSKDALLLCVGPRRLRINPVYSQHTRGGGRGANNVHKFERYLRHGATYIASVYGPAVFGKQPCMLLRETEDPQAPALVAMGTFMNPDPTRIAAKRIILTGHPFKVHKKTATVRYMFFNPDDVQYFAPVQLHTKYGRSGHIKESLGTHGYFKAHFDGPINQMDTVCMALYKRVYPRWSELWRGPAGAPQAHIEDVAMEE